MLPTWSQKKTEGFDLQTECHLLRNTSSALCTIIGSPGTEVGLFFIPDTSPCFMPPDKTLLQRQLWKAALHQCVNVWTKFTPCPSACHHISPTLPHSRDCPHTLHEGLADESRLWPGQPAETLPSDVSWMNLISLVFLNIEVMLRLEHPLAKSKLKGGRN